MVDDQGEKVKAKTTFTVEEVRKGAEQFVQYAGYQLLTPTYMGFVKSDLHAKRQTEKATYELVGVVRLKMEEAVEGYSRLAAAKAAYGDGPDYVLILPPIPEYFLLEWFYEERGRWFFELRREQFMMWLCNPERETTVCISGAPRDRQFNQYFAQMGRLTTGSWDAGITRRLSELLLREEIEEEKRNTP